MISCTAGGAVAFLVVMKVKVPNLERRIVDVEKKLSDQSMRISDANGALKFILREECHDMRHSCALGMEQDFKAGTSVMERLRLAIEELARVQQNNRTLQIGFMSAVKERLDLKFDVPNE
jgi:hypothetical protein